MKCPQCGYVEEEGSPFCSNCGAALASPVGGDEGAAQPVPEAQPPAPPPSPRGGVVPPPPPTGSPGAYPPTAQGSGPKRNWTPLLIGIIGVLVAVVVVLVLVFTVFTGDDGGGGGKQGDLSDPAAAVDAFFRAIEDGDVDSLIASIDPLYMDEFEDEYGQEYKSLLEDFFFAINPEGLEITGLEFEVEEDGDEAVVSVIAGTVTYVDANGEKVTEDVEENVITDFETVKVDGKWYVSMSTFPDWWYYLNASTGNGDGDGVGNLLYLHSDSLGVSIGYPQWWSAQEVEGGVIELRPIGDEDRVTVTLTSMEASGAEPDYEQWIDGQVETFDSLGWDYEYSYTDFGTYPAVEFEYSYVGEGQVSFTALDIYTEVNGRGYMLTYLAVIDAYETYIEDVREIIGSFEID